jgi:hypothetical protein
VSESLDKFFPIEPVLKPIVLTFNTSSISKPDNACERYRYDSHQMHCHSHQPIKDVYAKMHSPKQPTELIYCTARVCIPKKKLEYPRRTYVNLSLTCLNSTDPEKDAIPTESRTFDNNVRAQESQLFAVSSSLVLATKTCESWIISSIYKLMNDSELLTSHQGPKDIASR